MSILIIRIEQYDDREVRPYPSDLESSRARVMQRRRASPFKRSRAETSSDVD